MVRPRNVTATWRTLDAHRSKARVSLARDDTRWLVSLGPELQRLARMPKSGLRDRAICAKARHDALTSTCRLQRGKVMFVRRFSVRDDRRGARAAFIVFQNHRRVARRREGWSLTCRFETATISRATLNGVRGRQAGRRETNCGTSSCSRARSVGLSDRSRREKLFSESSKRGS